MKPRIRFDNTLPSASSLNWAQTLIYTFIILCVSNLLFNHKCSYTFKPPMHLQEMEELQLHPTIYNGMLVVMALIGII
jgi:hypothetical protein